MVALSYIKAVRRDLGVKCDVNVSVAPTFVRTEVKNVNSFSAIHAAILHEVERQNAEKVEDRKQQTRAWDDASGTTKFMRSKETALDYMFIPDPDLPVIVVTDELLTPIKANLPERPDQKELKFFNAGVPGEVAHKLSTNLYFANAAETIASQGVDISFVANRFINEIAGLVGDAYEIVTQIDTTLLANAMQAFSNRKVTNTEFKSIVEHLIKGESHEAKAMLTHASTSKQDDSALAPLVMDAIAANPVAVADVKKGNDKAINAIVGHVIKALKANGKSADPAVIQKVVREKL
jgi:aspartyl-tRNA(Asn)/glutamyl-tRNA(Gln) amidotransferase subunit B